MKPVSLADISYEQGLQLLALRKQALDSGKLTRMPSEALANSFPLRDIAHAYAEKLADDTLMDRLKSGIKSVGTQVQTKLQGGVNQLGEGLQGVKGRWDSLDEPTRTALTAGLAGTGLGAATGVASAVRRGDRRYGRSALRGGLAGAAMGGGLGVALTPGLADKVQSKGSDLIDKAQQYAKPEGAAPNKPASGVPRFRDRKSGEPVVPPTPEEKLQSLAQTADSYAPEAIFGGMGGVALVGGGLGTKKIVNRKTFDTDALADHIWSQATRASKKGEPGGVDPVALSRLLGDSAGAAPDAGKKLIEDIRKGAVTPENIAERLRAAGHTPNRFGQMKGSPSFWSNLTGNTGGGTAKAVSDVFGADKLKDVTEAAARSGLRNANRSFRKGRIRSLGGLATAALSALGNAGYNYWIGDAERSEAADALPVRAQSQP